MSHHRMDADLFIYLFILGEDQAEAKLNTCSFLAFRHTVHTHTWAHTQWQYANTLNTQPLPPLTVPDTLGNWEQASLVACFTSL